MRHDDGCLIDNFPMIDCTDTDPLTIEIMSKIRDRAAIGLQKYGVTVHDRNDLTLIEWIEHLKEELMDSIVYLTKIQELIKMASEKVKIEDVRLP